MRKIKIALLLLALNFACTPRAFEKQSAPTPAASPVTAEEKQAAFQAEVEKMRTADLKFVFVFRRADGAPIDGEDKKFLKANLPFTNRIYVADDDKAVIIGSNYPFPPENLNALRTRFGVEDFSTPAPGSAPPANQPVR